MQGDKLPQMPTPWSFAGDRKYTQQQMIEYALAARKMLLDELKLHLLCRGAGDDSSRINEYEAGSLDAINSLDDWADRELTEALKALKEIK